MERYFGLLTIVLLPAMVLIRARLMKSEGLQAIHFGRIDKKDFLIPPFALFYFYIVVAAALDFPLPSRQTFFSTVTATWSGALLCLAGLVLLFLSLLSFGRSFRIGIDQDRPDKLVTTGIFAVSRNPIYVAFALVLLGEFLLFPNWILLVYLFAAAWLFHRQILREEEFLRKRYGLEYRDYCRSVRRYF